MNDRTDIGNNLVKGHTERAPHQTYKTFTSLKNKGTSKSTYHQKFPQFIHCINAEREVQGKNIVFSPILRKKWDIYPEVLLFN